MGEFKLGKTSLSRLATCHPVWQKIVEEAIEKTPFDFGVVCGFRSKHEQDKAFVAKKSNARWGESDHNFMKGDKPCSLAVDLAPYSAKLKNYEWDNQYSFYRLYELISEIAGKYGHSIIWGGNFKSFRDMPHFGLKL